MRRFILRALAQIVYRFAEKTGPEVTYSERNYKVANAALAIQDLSKLF